MNKVKLDTGYISGTKVSQSGQTIYLYKGIPYAAPPVGELRWKPPQPAAPWRREGCVAAHGMELHYVFGALDDTESWAAAQPGYASSGAKSSVPSISDSDRRVAENIQTIRTTFARTGNPSVKGLIEWPVWDRETDNYLLITDPLQVKGGYTKLLDIKPDTSKQTIF